MYVEGGNQFEYHNDPEKTADSISKQGWNTLGDIGYLDEEGFLYLTDRKGNTINSGGVNIYPQEVENTLTIHDEVMDAAVFGVPISDIQSKLIPNTTWLDPLAGTFPGLIRFPYWLYPTRYHLIIAKKYV